MIVFGSLNFKHKITALRLLCFEIYVSIVLDKLSAKMVVYTKLDFLLSKQYFLRSGSFLRSIKTNESKW